MTLAETLPRPGARAAVSAAFFANGLVAGSWAPLVPVILLALDLTESDVGLLILAGGAAGFLGLLAAPGAIARLGSRRVCIAGGLAAVPAPFLMASAPSWGLAMLAFVHLFLALSVMDVAMNANGAAVERLARRPLMSSFHGFWSMGAMTGAGAGGFLIAGLGAEGQTLLAGAACLALVLIAAPGLDRGRSGGSGPFGAGFSRRGRVWAMAVLALAAFVCEGAVIDWSALYLRQEHGADVRLSGLAFAGFSLAMLAARFSGDALRARLGPVALLRASAAVSAAGFLLAGLAPSLPLALAGFLLGGLGCANLVPVAFSAAARTAETPASGIATATLLGYAGLLTAPAGFGHVAEATGFAPIFAAFALPLALGLLLARAARGTG